MCFQESLSSPDLKINVSLVSVIVNLNSIYTHEPNFSIHKEVHPIVTCRIPSDGVLYVTIGCTLTYSEALACQFMTYVTVVRQGCHNKLVHNSSYPTEA